MNTFVITDKIKNLHGESQLKERGVPQSSFIVKENRQFQLNRVINLKRSYSPPFSRFFFPSLNAWRESLEN